MEPIDPRIIAADPKNSATPKPPQPFLMPKSSPEQLQLAQVTRNLLSVSTMLQAQLYQNDQLLKAMDAQNARLSACELELLAFKKEAQERNTQNERKRQSQEFLKQEAKKQKIADYNNAITMIGERIKAHEKNVAVLVGKFLNALDKICTVRHANLEALITTRHTQTQELLNKIHETAGNNSMSVFQNNIILESLNELSASEKSEEWDKALDALIPGDE